MLLFFKIKYHKTFTPITKNISLKSISVYETYNFCPTVYLKQLCVIVKAEIIALYDNFSLFQGNCPMWQFLAFLSMSTQIRRFHTILKAAFISGRVSSTYFLVIQFQLTQRQHFTQQCRQLYSKMEPENTFKDQMLIHYRHGLIWKNINWKDYLF